MAAGDIILSNGTTITAAEIQQIAAEVKKDLAAESKELSQFEEVTSLTNVSSLPGIQQSGATMKLVRVALSILKGLDGKNVELSASSTAIQWRNVGDSTWETLVELSLLKGDKGDAGEKVMLRKTASGIEWKYANEADSAYKTLVSIDDIKLKFSDLTDDDKAELTKIPILGTVTAKNGSTPSGNFTTDGYDSNGNPKYVLHLTVTKGDKGEPPIIEEGTTTTGLPDTEASVEVVPNGQTEQGNPKYLLNFTIPAGKPGQDGTGSGNVYVAETGLVSGKKYLFQPGANDSANGTFVEYVEPTIPEQVQPDWNATEGKGAILNKPTIIPDAPKDGKQYARKDGAWEEVEAGDELSKDAIEQALTGNITTHRHDTTYNYTDFETDVWDGTSISTSLQGSGTKDDPYLIQSCADWVYLRSHATDLVSSSITSFVVFELKKNLDFGNKPISTASVASISGLEIDGGGATIFNYAGSDGILGIKGCMICFFHDIKLKNVNLQINDPNTNVSSGFFGGQGDLIYNDVQNVTIQGKVTISGDLSEDAEVGIGAFSYLGYIGMAPAQEFDPAGYIRDYTKERGCHLGLDVTVDDQTVKTNGEKLLVQRGVVIVRTAEEDADVKLEGYDNSFGNITFESSEPVFEGELGVATAVSIQATDGISASFDASGFYRNSEKSQGIVLNTTSGLFQMVDAPTKTTSEMQSDAFVELLNEGLETPVFLKDKDGGTPVLAPKNATIGYDGYVRKSEFESFKKNINVEEPPAVIDSLSSESTTDALSANMGKKLNNEKVGSSEIRTIKKLTQSEYDGLSSKDSNTLYVIVG